MALSRVESCARIRFGAHWMFLAVKLGCYLCIALAHQILVDEPSVHACVSWDVLPAHHVCWSSDPGLTVPRPIRVHFWRSVFAGRQLGHGRLLLLLQFQGVQFLLISAAKLDFSVDLSRCLSDECALRGHEACVARHVVAVPPTGA